MLKTGDQKKLSIELKAKQISKGVYDSPCVSICDYDGLFKQCQTCRMRQAEKTLWKTEGQSFKDTVLRAISKRKKD
ncbi:MAG: DUF1289 domain-containing protein [Halobacteriovoraceae bacterium]|jgi:predicted Fe-S protein YdhL (DUF1289 family)|nr:DUF1289 domain-containing protein [Halobacteriovoraceae bacterium]